MAEFKEVFKKAKEICKVNSKHGYCSSDCPLMCDFGASFCDCFFSCIAYSGTKYTAKIAKAFEHIVLNPDSYERGCGKYSQQLAQGIRVRGLGNR